MNIFTIDCEPSKSWGRPHSDLVPVPKHGARAPIWTLCRHASALNRAWSQTTRKSPWLWWSWQQIWSWCFNSLWESKYGGHSGWWKPVQISAHARSRFPSTNSGASARAQVRFPNLCSSTNKRLCSVWCPCTGHLVWLPILPCLIPGHHIFTCCVQG